MVSFSKEIAQWQMKNSKKRKDLTDLFFSSPPQTHIIRWIPSVRGAALRARRTVQDSLPAVRY